MLRIHKQHMFVILLSLTFTTLFSMPVLASVAEDFLRNSGRQKLAQAKEAAREKKKQAYTEASVVEFWLEKEDGSRSTISFVTDNDAAGDSQGTIVDFGFKMEASEKILRAAAAELEPQIPLIVEYAKRADIPAQLLFIVLAMETHYHTSGNFKETLDETYSWLGSKIGIIQSVYLPSGGGGRNPWRCTLGIGQTSPELLSELITSGPLHRYFYDYLAKVDAIRAFELTAEVESAKPNGRLPERYFGHLRDMLLDRNHAVVVRAAYLYMVQQKKLNRQPDSALELMQMHYAHQRFFPADRYAAFKNPKEVLRLILFDDDKNYPPHAEDYELGFPHMLWSAFPEVMALVAELLDLEETETIIPDREIDLTKN